MKSFLCSCGHLLRSSCEKEKNKCLECQIAEALKAGSLGEPLPVPVPPNLEEACGYYGEAKKVALFWGAGDEAYYHDGRVCSTGEWDAFLAYVHHRMVKPYLTPYNLGSSEEEATHWFVLDRTKRQVTVQRHDKALRLVREQWTSLEDVKLPSLEMLSYQRRAEINEVIDQLSKSGPVPHLEIVQRMQEHQKVLQEMLFWLEKNAPSSAPHV